jgi:hypothetical protein
MQLKIMKYYRYRITATFISTTQLRDGNYAYYGKMAPPHGKI